MIPTSLADLIDMETYLALPVEQRAKLIERLLSERKKVYTKEQCELPKLNPYFLEN